MTYAGLSEARKDFVREAIEASELELAEHAIAPQGSTLWMRHTASVRLDECDADAIVISDHLGHASIETTMRYVKTQEQRWRAQIQDAIL